MLSPKLLARLVDISEGRESIGIARVVIVGASAVVDIAEIVAVIAIRRARINKRKITDGD